MSANKYSSLPDIDSAPDIYETPDSFNSSHQDANESGDEEGVSTRIGRDKLDEITTKEELDGSHLPDSKEVGKKFRKAEKKRERPRTFEYLPASNDTPASPTSHTRRPPLQDRLRSLQHELATLEAELSSPNELERQQQSPNGEVPTDPGIMIRNLVELRGRFDKLAVGRLDTTKSGILVNKVLELSKEPKGPQVDGLTTSKGVISTNNDTSESEAKTIAEIDRRLGELERLIGASSTSLEETSPLPHPLLPHITRLSSLLTLLTQPRHIDSISRRLKLLLTDLERYSNATNRRQGPTSSTQPPSNTPQQPPHELAPVLNRIAPALPTIPHLLARLKTLSTLHASASSFSSTLSLLEEEQKKFRSGLEDLEKAVDGVEKSFEVNTERVENNLKGLQTRLDIVQKQLGAVVR